MKLSILFTFGCLVMSQSAFAGLLEFSQTKQPVKSPSCNYSTSASFLWWRPSENLSNFAEVVTREEVIGVGIDTSGFPKGHRKSISYEWSPGFTLRAGSSLFYDDWDFFADWTWYHNTTNDKVMAATNSAFDTGTGLIGSENGLGIYGSWLGKWVPSDVGTSLSQVPIQLVYPGPFATAQIKWHLAYDTINAECGKSFRMPSNLIRLFFGLRGLTVTRTLAADYEQYNNLGSLLTFVPNYFGFQSAAYASQFDFWGIGPSLGVLDEFCLPKNVRLMGQLSAALLYGPSRGSENFSLTDLSQGLPSLFGGTKFGVHTIWGPATHLQMRLGLEWATYVDCNHTMQLFFSAAWEQHIWLFHAFSSSIQNGDASLGLGGLTFTTQFNF